MNISNLFQQGLHFAAALETHNLAEMLRSGEGVLQAMADDGADSDGGLAPVSTIQEEATHTTTEA